MVYTDLIFILAVFPLTTVVSLLDRSAEYKNMVLILTSLLFFSWGRSFGVCLIFLTVVTDWLLGLGAAKLRGRSGKDPAGLLPVAASAVLNVLAVIYYNKNFLPAAGEVQTVWYVQNLSAVYYCLRGFSSVYDVYKGKTGAEKNIFCLMTYMLSYHFMCAGPLVRYGDIQSQIRSREVTGDKLNTGLNCIFLGLGKAVILSDLFAGLRQTGLGSEITTAGSWIGMLSFAAELYFLFTGLCDISRGLCLTCGFVLPANYREIDPDELFSGFAGGVNCTVVGFFKDLLGISGSGGAPSAVRLTFCSGLCALMTGGFYMVKDRAGMGAAAAAAAAALLVTAEQAGLKKAMKGLPAAVKYIYLLLTVTFIAGLAYFDSFGAFRRWAMTLVGIGTPYTLSVAMRDLLLHRLTLIIIAFFAVCAPAKKWLFSAGDKLSARSRGWYGSVRAVKTLCTALVFIMSIMTLVVRVTGV